MSESAVFAVILLNSYFLFYNLSVPAVTSRLFPGFIIFIFYKITEYCHSFNEARHDTLYKILLEERIRKQHRQRCKYNHRIF